MKSEMTFAGVKTTQNQPGKKMTKSIFRQLPLYKATEPWSDSGAVRKNCTILGWVNYSWKGDGLDPWKYQHLHVLCKEGNTYFRSFIYDAELCQRFCNKKLPQDGQIFLGDFFMAAG